MTEDLEAEQTPEELRTNARLLLARSWELRQMADDLTKDGDALLKRANGKISNGHDASKVRPESPA